MKKEIIGIAALILLSGCTNMSVSNFNKSEHSGVRGNKVALIFIEPKEKNEDLIKISPVINEDTVLQSMLEATCGVPVQATTESAVVGLIATAGKLLFDMFMDNQVRQIEGLKMAAQAAYSEKRLISGADLKKQSCALVVRYKEIKEGAKDYGLVALVKLVKQSDDRSFVIEPLYVRAKNAVVVTEKPSEANESATIGLSVGVSIKAITKLRSNVLSLQRMGEGLVSIPNLALGPNSKPVKCETKSKCSTSDLIPYPETGKEVVSVTVSVAEVGKINVDFDQSIAEVKAIKEAIGPVLKDTIKDFIKD